MPLRFQRCSGVIGFCFIHLTERVIVFYWVSLLSVFVFVVFVGFLWFSKVLIDVLVFRDALGRFMS